MSTIRFKVSTWTASGIRIPATSGKAIAIPTSLVIVSGDPDEIVPKTEVSAPLVDGYAELILDPPGLTWCWNIKVLFGDQPILKGYYTFAETFAPLDFPRDLTEVILSTLTPSEEAIPGWEAAVEIVQESVDAASGFAATAHQEALSAATSAVLSDASSDLALEYQNASQVAQGLSEDARDASQLAQSRAETAQGLSEDAQSKAEIAQGLAEQAVIDAETEVNSAVNSVVDYVDSQTAGALQSATNASNSAGVALQAKIDAQEAQSKAEIAQGLAEQAETNAASNVSTAVNNVVQYVNTKASEANVSAGASAGSAAAALLSEQHAAQSELDAQAAKEAAELAESNTNAVAFTASSSTLTPGVQATASITGTAPNFNLAVGVPAGRDAFVESPTPPVDHTVLWVDPTTPSLPESGSPFELRGDGSPEGVKIAAVGTLYTDRICSSGVWRWVKTSGSGDTGWTPQPAALTLTNLVNNGDFAQGITNWVPAAAVGSVTSKILTLTGDGSEVNPRANQTIVSSVVGHKYYTMGQVRVNNANCVQFEVYSGGIAKLLQSSPVSGTWYQVSTITTAVSINQYLSFRSVYSDSATANSTTMDVKNILHIDLTATFGAGFEPTKEEMDAYFSKNPWFGGSQPLKPKISLGSPLELTGNGSPLGVVSAPVGSYYTDLLGTCGAWRWMKQSGTGNTGWVVVVGDTLWRDIRNLYGSTVVEGSTSPKGSRIRRVNNQILYEGVVKPAGASIGTNRTSGLIGIISTIPAGFGVSVTFYPRGLVSFGSHLASIGTPAYDTRLDINGFVTPTGVWVGTDAMSMTATWTTADHWPTTLPGS